LALDHQTDLTNLAPGSHSIEVLSSPADYFSDNLVSVSIGLLTPHDGVTLSGDALTIADYVTDSKGSLFRITLTKDGKSYNDENHKYSVSNPSGKIESDLFPGVAGFTWSYNGETNVTLTAGANFADVAILTSDRCKLALTPENYSFTSQIYSAYVDVMTTGTDLSKAKIAVHSSTPDRTLLTLSLVLSSTSGNARITTTNALYITISNPNPATS
jgi:hypothetical protein